MLDALDLDLVRMFHGAGEVVGGLEPIPRFRTAAEGLVETNRYLLPGGFSLKLEEYKQSGRARYERLAKIVSELLEREIISKSGYQLQQIQHRAKTPESLSRRLKELDQLETDEIETHRKDLAGCRIIFYTNNDVNQFTRSGLLNELFEVDWKRSSFHQPGLGGASVAGLFQSYNYVLKLKADRTALIEYCEFDGLFCEVQVQTILNHAWAEMAHDTIYKPPELRDFGGKELKAIRQRLDDVMRKHLLPAGDLFQRIAIDVQQLADGKALLDADILNAVSATENNNNERYELLARIKDNFLPLYDDPSRIFVEVSEKLRKAWVIASSTEAVPHETPFGNYPGIEFHHVTARIVGIIEQYRYVDLHETYIFIRDLYVQTSNAESRDQLVKLAKQLARHTFQIWESDGPIVQVRLAQMLSKEKDISSIAPVATTIASEILKTKFTGPTWNSNKVEFHRGVIIYSDALKKARRTVIEIIATYAENVVGDDDALRDAIGCFFDAEGGSGFEPENPKLKAMILSDLSYALGCIIKFAPKASLNVRQEIECRLLQYYRWNRTLPEHFASVDGMVEIHGQLLETMLALRGTLNADEEFVVFKTITGTESVFSHQWEENRLDRKKNKTVRYQQQDEFADSITPKNWSIWKSRLAIAAAVKSRHFATLVPYKRFLSAISSRQPNLAFELLSDRSILPDWTIRPIATDLVDGKTKEDVYALLGQWLDEGRFVREISGFAVLAKNVDTEFISKTAARAIEDANKYACTNFVESAIMHYPDDPQFWRDEIFFPCLSVLQQASAHDWIDSYWHQSGGDFFFASLSNDQNRIVLEAMLNVDHISGSAEEILKTIAATQHQLVLDWFGRRIEIADQKSSVYFDPVPFLFQSVHEALRPHPKDIIASMRIWLKVDKGNARWRIPYFLSRIYRNFEEPLPSALFDIVNNGDAADLAFVSLLLQGFDDQENLLPILHAILASSVVNDEIEADVSRVLHKTGVMFGEFGLAQTYQFKAETIRPWLQDENKRVSEFAAREIRSLEHKVADENRRTREEIAMYKLQHGESLNDDLSENDNDDGDDTGPK